MFEATLNPSFWNLALNCSTSVPDHSVLYFMVHPNPSRPGWGMFSLPVYIDWGLTGHLIVRKDRSDSGRVSPTVNQCFEALGVFLLVFSLGIMQFSPHGNGLARFKLETY